MPPPDQALDDIDGAPARCASGEPPEPPCPCCGHIRAVRPLAAAIPPPPRDPYGPLFTIFRTDFYRADAFGQSPLVTGGWRALGIAAPTTPERRTFARTLRPPRPPWTMGQAIDRRLTVVIDLAFLGLTLYLFGRLIQAVELDTLALFLGALALLARPLVCRGARHRAIPPRHRGRAGALRPGHAPLAGAPLLRGLRPRLSRGRA